MGMAYKEPQAIRPFGEAVDESKIIDPSKFKKPEPSQIIATDKSLETQAIVAVVESNINASQEAPTKPAISLAKSEVQTVAPVKPIDQRPLHSGRNAYVLKNK